MLKNVNDQTYTHNSRRSSIVHNRFSNDNRLPATLRFIDQICPTKDLIAYSTHGTPTVQYLVLYVVNHLKRVKQLVPAFLWSNLGDFVNLHEYVDEVDNNT